MISKPKQCSGCGESKIIWKNHKGEKFCKNCWYKKTPVKFPKQKIPLKSRSDKRVILDQLYSVSRQQFLVKNPFCHARLEGCTINATDVHHKAGRNKNYLDVLTWLSACRTCHQWIELHPIEAKEMGLSTPRLQKDDIDCD